MRLRSRGPVPQRAVGADRVVCLPPSLDEHLGFQQRVEHPPGQELILQLAVEALHVPILPRRTGLDVELTGLDLLYQAI